ncbi:MAG: universal stress protein [Nitrospiria bacterium]
MNILAAVDFSENTGKILDEVKSIASVLSAKVWLLHVAEPKPGFMGYVGNYVDYGSGYVDYGPDPKTLRSQIAKKFHSEHRELQKEAETIRKMGMETTALLIQGTIVKAILQEAEKLHADMIVIGSHGHGAVYKMLMGSVSEGVLRQAACPVLVVPTHDRQG